MLEKAEMKSIRNCLPTLQELAGRVIKKFKINYAGHVPNHLLRYRYLDFSLRCCFQTYCCADHVAHVDVTIHSMFLPSAYFQVGACSQKCLTIWKENINARLEMNYE